MQVVLKTALVVNIVAAMTTDTWIEAGKVCGAFTAIVIFLVLCWKASCIVYNVVNAIMESRHQLFPNDGGSVLDIASEAVEVSKRTDASVNKIIEKMEVLTKASTERDVRIEAMSHSVDRALKHIHLQEANLNHIKEYEQRTSEKIDKLDQQFTQKITELEAKINHSNP